MNAFAPHEPDHQAYLCLGSNIRPVANLLSAIELLRQRTQLQALSTCWESAAVGSDGPNFFNIGALVSTPLDAPRLKEQILAPIENALGRVRSANKYAPRTMDIDIVIFDGQVLDAEIWRRVYLALIFAEMIPSLANPDSGEMLAEIAQRLPGRVAAIPHPELIFRND